MHDLLCTDDFSTERRPNGLVAQAYPEKRDFSGEMCQNFKRNTRFIRSFRSRRYTDMVRFEPLDLFESNFIVTESPDVDTQFPEVLNEVICKRIVIINHQ